MFASISPHQEHNTTQQFFLWDATLDPIIVGTRLKAPITNSIFDFPKFKGKEINKKEREKKKYIYKKKLLYRKK